MSIETEQELAALRRAGRLVQRALERMRAHVREGVTTGELDGVGEQVLTAHGGRSAPMLFYDFPGWTCISVNDEVVHGVPGDRRLEKGDMVTLDVTAELDGYVADAAITVIVPPAPALALALQACAEAAFWKGFTAARAGVALHAIGAAVEREVKRRGFQVLRELNGHGVGRRIHEPPSVPNYFEPRARTRLTRGLVIALEPLICATTEWTREADDGWTVLSADGGLTAHFEHTIVVTDARPVVLTAA
jgi:methionyl aminopeptidase